MPKDSQKQNKEIGYVKPREITEEMKESYLDYAMSVIISRALPDVRDGLKPVHRRILYTMLEEGLRHNAKFRKSATVVGSTLGRYHPHGDTAVYDALVRMAQDFSLRYPLIQGQGNFGCFTKDTKVRLTNGRNLNFEELIKEQKKGKRHWSFTFNTKTKKIEITEIKNPRLTRKKEKIMEIVLDNGEKIKCTLDHRFMLRSGGYKQTQDLKAGDSLMPLYAEVYNGKEDKNLEGYERILQPMQNNWEFTHHLADKWNLEDRVYEKSAGRIRHHKDFNKLNNNPDNVIRIQWQDHWRFHKEISSERHRDNPEYVKRIAAGRKKYWAKKEHRELRARLQAERNKVMWRNPKYRQAWIEARKKMWEDPEYKKFMRKASSKNLKRLWKRKDFQELLSKLKSEEMKKRWQDEKYRAYWKKKTKEISLKIWSNPEHREYISKLTKERLQDSQLRKEISERSKKLWKDPVYRAKYPLDYFRKIGKKPWNNPEFYKNQIEKAKKQWQDPEFKEKIIKAVKARNRQRLKEKPEFMKQLTEKAKISLHKNWKDPSYKSRIIKSKILGYVYSLLSKYPKVTPKVYEKERINNGVPKIENALQYFSNFSEIIEKAKNYNHKVVTTRILSKREDVYDLTVEPWHNFALAAGIFVHNSIDGDNSAASRYTECRLSGIGEEMLQDIEKDTVDFRPNYDGTRKEPTVLSSPLPQLLLNGSLGIAVGMATNIPPHNVSEVLQACIYLIDHPQSTTEDIFQFIQGPDFPTGGLIYGKKDIISAYSQGKGGILMRGKAEIREQEKGNFRIIITEIPFQVQKSDLVREFAKLVEEKKIEGVKNIRDESDREGMRIVIDLRREAFPKKVLNALYKYTSLQKTFHLNMLALVDGIQPRVLSLSDILILYLKHKKEVVLRRTKFDLQRAKERAHILEGLMIALKNIDEVIKTIKKSESREEAQKNLIKKFKLTQIQATAILEMRLQNLAKLEREKIEKELKEIKKRIKELTLILRNPKKLKEVIKEELKEMKEKYSDERRTKVVSSKPGEIGEEELIPKAETIIILTKGGFIKRVKPSLYKTQKRGGKGIIGMEITKEDMVEHFLASCTLDKLLFFTDSGKIFQCQVWEIPEMGRVSKGRGLLNFLEISPTEKVLKLIPYSKEDETKKKYLVMVTRGGIIKKTELSTFKNVRRNGLRAIKLGKEDFLCGAKIVNPGEEIILLTKKGKSIRFKEKDLRVMGREAAGVRGVRLGKGPAFAKALTSAKALKDKSAGKDEVIMMDVIEKSKIHLLVITENGYGKRTKIKEYRLQKRGGSGIKAAKITEKTGEVVFSQVLEEEEKDLFVISKKGHVIRITIGSISILGRVASGVRVMKLAEGDKIASAICL